MKNSASSYGLSKPILIAEFNKDNGINDSGVQMFNAVYNNGFAGALGW